MASGASRTSNTRSKLTIEVIRSTRAFVRPVSGWYTRVTSAASATSVPTSIDAVDHHERADAVDRCGADGADETQGHEEHPPEHRRLDAGVAHTLRPPLEGLLLAGARAEQLHEARTGHVEAFGHLGVHGRVVGHLLA